MERDKQPSYAEVDQFSLSGPDGVGVGALALALASRDTVEVVTTGDRTTIDIDAPVVDVAVGDYVFVLAEEEIRALTTSGVRLWSVTVDSAERIATVDDAGVLVVVTGAELVGLNGETGSEVFRTDRPYADVRGDTSVVGSGSAVAIGAWSFLVAVDGNGTVTLEENLDGAIRDLATFSDRFVVALKGGDLLAIGPDGDRLWESGLAVDGLAPVGKGWLPVTSDGRCYAVDGVGQHRDLDVGATESVVATPDGSLLVTVADGTARVHQPAADIEPTLTATLDAAKVVPGDPLAVTLTNDTAVPIEATVTPSGTGITFESGGRRIELPPDGERKVSFGTTGADGEEATIRVESDGQTLVERTVPVKEPTAGGDTIDVETDDFAVVDGTVRTDVTLVNRGDRRLEGVTVAGAESSVPGLDPGERATVAVESPVEFGEAAQQIATVEHGGETVAPVEVETGDPPKIAVERTDEEPSAFVDVTVENAAVVPVTETLQVNVDGGPTVERTLTLDPDERLLAALPLARPPTDAFAVTAALPGVGVERRVELDGWDDARYGRRQEPGGGREGGTDGTPHEQHADSTPREEQANAPDNWADVDAAGDRSASKVLQTAGPLTDEDDAGRPDLDVSRAVESGDVSERLHDRIRVQNVGTAPAHDLTLSVGDRKLSLGNLDPQETVTVGQTWAFYEPGDHELPAGRLEGDTVTASIGSETVSVDPVGLAATVTVRPTDQGTAATFDVKNQADDPIRVGILGLGRPVEDIEVQHELDAPRRVDPGETTTIEWMPEPEEWDCPPTGTVLKAAIAYERGGTEQVRNTLARSVDGDENGVTVEIKECERVVVGENGFVDVVIRNGSDDTVRDVTLAATGAPISEMYYSPDTVERIGPGETVTHEVVLRPEQAGSVAFDLAVEGDGGADIAAFDIAGPAASDQTEWDESLATEWEIRRREKEKEEGRTADDGPECLVTDFRQE